MKRSYFIIGISVLIVLFGVWRLLDREPKQPTLRGKDVIAFGDSLIYGVGSSQGGGFIKMVQDDTGIKIVNLGVSGNTTQDALNRLHDLDSYDPKLVIVLLGGNDFLRRVPREETKKNLGMIIRAIQEKNSRVLLLGVRSGIFGDTFDYKALAKEHGVAYEPDVLEGLFGKEEYMFDSIHPNDKGYRVIANRIKPTFLKLLQ